MIHFLARVGQGVRKLYEHTVAYIIFMMKIFGSAAILRHYPDQYAKEWHAIVVRSFPIIILTAIFTGAVLVLQTYVGFDRFHQRDGLSYVVSIALTRELAPVLTALVLSGSVGSYVASELGMMNATYQRSALDVMGFSSLGYLVVPKMIMVCAAMVLFVGLFDAVGMISSYVTATTYLHMNGALYIKNTIESLRLFDVVSGIIKGLIFGFLVGLNACYFGYQKTRAMQGVGQATTSALVVSAWMIFLFNMVLTGIFFHYG